MIRTKYSDQVMDHYNKPRNVGSLDKSKNTVGMVKFLLILGTGIVGAPACGDVMKLQIEIDEKTGVITEAKFRTFGCGSAIASSSVATEWIKGKTLDQATAITNNDIASHLALPPVKLHCSLLAEQAIRAAVNDIKKKSETVI